MTKQNNHQNQTGSIKSNRTIGTGKLAAMLGLATVPLSFAFVGLEANATYAAQLSLSIPDNIELNVSPSGGSAYGTFSESDPSSVSVSTDNIGGYDLSVKAKTSTDLINSAYPEAKLTSISDNLSRDQYQNGNYPNTWAFKPDYYNNELNTLYRPGPNTSGILLAKATTNTLSRLTGKDQYNLAIAAKVDDSLPAGQYSNTFIMTATANTLKYSIKYNNNGGAGGPTAPQEGDIGDDLEVQINSETPSMEGKDFLGWCTKQPKEDGSCTGVVVQPAGCFPLCRCNLDLTLYAMYGTKSSSSGSSNGNFYGLANGTDCEYYGIQGKVYAGRCWMSSNFKTSRAYIEAKEDCDEAGWALPTKYDFIRLIGNDFGVGNSDALYQAGWGVGYYWSSTPYQNVGSNFGYYLHVTNSSAEVSNVSGSFLGNSGHANVRCVSP